MDTIWYPPSMQRNPQEVVYSVYGVHQLWLMYPLLTNITYFYIIINI